MIEVPVVPALFFAAATSFAIFSSILYLVIHAEVNRRLPENQQISYLFGYYWKFRKVHQLYAQFYPEGKLALLLKICIGCGLFFLLAAAWTLGFL